MLPMVKPTEKPKKGGFMSNLKKKMDGVEIELMFKDKKPEDMVPVDDGQDGTSTKMYLFNDNEPVVGAIELRPKGKLSHQGIHIEFVGVITANNDKEEKTEFMKQDKTFQAEGGTIAGPIKFDFDFDTEKLYDSYRGINAKVQYFIRMKIVRSMVDVERTWEVWVSRIESQFQEFKDRCEDKSYHRETCFSKGVGMEVGVDDILHIEFRYDKKVFHIKERIVGEVRFKVAKLDLHCGEVSLVRREYIGTGQNQFFETQTLQKFEIMDGLPVPGEVVPIRLYLNSVPLLTPTYNNVNKIFSVKYFVNLVLVTQDGKRYFKQQEVTIYRRKGQEAPTPMVIGLGNRA